MFTHRFDFKSSKYQQIKSYKWKLFRVLNNFWKYKESRDEKMSENLSLDIFQGPFHGYDSMFS